MKVSNGQVWTANQAIGPLLKEPWPVKTAWALAKLAQTLKERAVPIDQVRANLVNQYGEADERGRFTISDKSPGWGEFVPSFNELMEHEEEIDVEPVKLPTGKETDAVRVTGEALLNLGPFIEVG